MCEIMKCLKTFSSEITASVSGMWSLLSKGWCVWGGGGCAGGKGGLQICLNTHVSMTKVAAIPMDAETK